jgi:hypothetical protein
VVFQVNPDDAAVFFDADPAYLAQLAKWHGIPKRKLNNAQVREFLLLLGLIDTLHEQLLAAAANNRLVNTVPMTAALLASRSPFTRARCVFPWLSATKLQSSS